MKVSTTQYAKALLELTENKSEQEIVDVVKNFSEQLRTDGQLKNSAGIIEKFSGLYNSAHGIVDAEVVTSRKLGSEQISRLEIFIKEKYAAKEIIISNVVDESIKGGIIVKVGDDIIDGSVSGQLKRLRNILSK